MSFYQSIYKKLLTVGTAAVVMAGVAAPTVSQAEMPFKDISGQYTVPAENLYENGIVKGLSSTEFGKDNQIKRGDTAVMIANALGLDTATAPDAGFKDVNSRFTPAVNTLFEKEIINGISPTKFDPDGMLTRGAMASILVRAYQIPPAEKDSPFKDAVGSFGEAIHALHAAGITGGKSPDTFGKDDPITRGEFAVLLFKTMNQFGACDYDPSSTVNPDLQTISCLITEAVKESGTVIPPEIVKAVAEEESGWKQFDAFGNPVMNTKGDGGIGMMQITSTAGYDVQKLKYDLKYNIKVGIEFLEKNFYQRTDLPKINDHDPMKLESWYFAVMAYNGIVPVNSPVKQEDGERNTAAYQEKVYRHLEAGNLEGSNIDQLFMKPEDFDYDRNSSAPIKFIKKEYQLSNPTPTTQLYSVGDLVTYAGKGLRSLPSTSADLITIAPGEKMRIIGKPIGDQNPKAENHYVWYLVQTVDSKKMGYIASPYAK